MFNFLNNITISQGLLWLLEIALLVTLGMLLYKAFTFNKAKETKIIRRQALTDPLTGRGNRYLFLSILDKLIKKSDKFAVCFMDLDGFKQINDTMGHDAGDKLLIALANTFSTKLPKNATAYRLGGDEFAIIIENVKTTADISLLLDNLKKDLTVPFVIENTNITLEYSLGIAIYPEDADNRQDLIMYADDAMYYIKEHGKNDYYFHNKALRAKLENNNKMEKDLKVAYDKNQFGFSLQPRINVNNIEKLCFEALLYWEHPVLGKIDSDYFIKQAEEIALIIKLDQHVLNMACKKLKEFKEKGYKNIQMAVNISNKHATRKDFIEKLCEILNSYDLEQGDIQIEFTGNIDPKSLESYKLMLEKLKECKADIIINNYEISYNSLMMFKTLPIDEIKISSEFVSTSSELDHEIFRNIIRLSKSLGYKIVVNMVEQETELVEAVCCGADKIQGNFLFKKIDDVMEEFIKSYPSYILRIDEIIDRAKKSKSQND